ncbi:MAG: hypothetical protein PHQ52_00230 [Candidatus Omnitrophica bacterium]|nr:hypothetical protein [Candidatus Omnitrophota bacterium]
MRKYIQPKIKAIQLHPEQSILAICAIGGLYLYYQTTLRVNFCGNITGTPAMECQLTPKGAAGGNSPMRMIGGDLAQSAAPS